MVAWWVGGLIVAVAWIVVVYLKGAQWARTQREYEIGAEALRRYDQECREEAVQEQLQKLRASGKVTQPEDSP